MKAKRESVADFAKSPRSRKVAHRSEELRVVGPIDPMPTGEPSVRIRLEDVFPLLLHAYRHQHVWLEDLASDPILVTEDLAQILAAYRETLETNKPA